RVGQGVTGISLLGRNFVVVGAVHEQGLDGDGLDAADGLPRVLMAVCGVPVFSSMTAHLGTRDLVHFETSDGATAVTVDQPAEFASAPGLHRLADQRAEAEPLYKHIVH